MRQPSILKKVIQGSKRNHRMSRGMEPFKFCSGIRQQVFVMYHSIKNQDARVNECFNQKGPHHAGAVLVRSQCSAESMTQFTGRKMTASTGPRKAGKLRQKQAQHVTHGRNFFNMEKTVANPNDECGTARMKCNTETNSGQNRRKEKRQPGETDVRTRNCTQIVCPTPER